MADIITIDGPTSSGKNSVGFLLSKRLGYQYIDTGMIYRVGTFLVLKNKISPDDIEKIADVFKRLNIEIKDGNDGLRIYNNDEDLTDILHTPEVTKNVSVVAAIKEVREATKLIQHRLGKIKNTVMTGRDIGSEIFPNARCKFFLTARVEVRAKRRYEQLKKEDPNTKYEEVLQSMIERDRQDSTRDVSPLRVPEGAITIDNSNLTVEQTVDKILSFC
ncbi:MAG: (d)CMP kinase [Patescibacteria group bacterium]|nr:(d)CMP kinase [Patescibacteria group bacterium]